MAIVIIFINTIIFIKIVILINIITIINNIIMQVRSGCGPRHMAFHQSKPFAYILCEQLPLVLVYRWTNMML